MPTPTTAPEPSGSLSTVKVATDIDGDPIILDDNPAHIDGALYEFGQWSQRTGHYIPLFENRGVLLNNGKLALESPNAALFANGTVKDPTPYSFERPFPPITNRINDFNFDALLHGTDEFKKFSVETLSPGFSDLFAINKYTVSQNGRDLMNSLLAMFTSSSTTQTYLSACAGSGFASLDQMRKDAASKVTPQDRVLIKNQFTDFVKAGMKGELSLSNFNEHYKQLRRRLRVLPMASRMGDEAIMQILNGIMFKDSGFSSLYEIVISATPPTDVDETVKAIRKLLRSRQVNQEIREGSIADPADPLSALIAKASSNGDMKQLKALVAAKAARLADPKKSRPSTAAAVLTHHVEMTTR